MTYFKKTSPKTKIYLSTGQFLAFENIDNEWGVYPPQGQGISPMLEGELRLAIANGRGGATEITAEEYASLLQKKKGKPLPKLWREEIGRGAPRDTGGQPGAPARPVEVPAAAVNLQPKPEKAPAPPDRPRASRRDDTQV